MEKKVSKDTLKKYLEEKGYNKETVTKAIEITEWLYYLRIDEAQELLEAIALSSGFDEVNLNW